MQDSELQRFQNQLLAYTLAEPAACRPLEADIWRRYGAVRAVMVLDMSGFTRLSLTHGIVHYLAMVRRMQLMVEPVVADHGGQVVKFEADNAFTVFPEPLAAATAAIELNRRFDAANDHTPDEQDIHVCCGIDYGRLLLVGRHEFFGDPVNRASKLGEELAGAREILLTDEAMARVPPGALAAQPRAVELAGRPARVHLISY